jgi:hypothetical protein
MVATVGLGITGIAITTPRIKPSTTKQRIDQSQRRINLLVDSSLDITLLLITSPNYNRNRKCNAILAGFKN